MIERLRVQQFRRHGDMSTQLHPGSTIIVGPNGSGKTSLLEALYISLVGKSWRSNFTEILRDTDHTIADWWRIDVDGIGGESRIVKFHNGQKTFQIGEKAYTRLPTKQKQPVILFEPNDLQLLYGSPTRRRDFLDRFIIQTDPTFSTTLNKFARILKQRNNLLKSGFATKENLFVWDIQFANLAEKITRVREEWVMKLNKTITENYQNISGQLHQTGPRRDRVSISYTGKKYSQPQILHQLHKEFQFGSVTTKIGPQTHDLLFQLNGHDAKTSASRGENRTILFATLAVQIELLNQLFDRPVYVILDDIDSELDDVHQKNLYTLPLFQKNYLFATTIRCATKNIFANVIEFKQPANF
jgi:DNA replication and repair protein RecF